MLCVSLVVYLCIYYKLFDMILVTNIYSVPFTIFCSSPIPTVPYVHVFDYAF